MGELAIVGLGSWGLCVLERAVARARRTGSPTTIHVVEPGRPGGGVYAAEQPDYLVLNNACGQLSLYAAPEDGEDPPYAMGLFEWAVERGYRWHGHECRIGPGGLPIEPTDYLPRRLMGEYLTWFHDALVASAPPNVTVVHHRSEAIDITPAPRGGEVVRLASGAPILVDHVVLTSGHTFNRNPDDARLPLLRPYPIDHFDPLVGPGAQVAIAGMGLVAFDLITGFTVGRGGRFEPDGSRLKYEPSGREPEVYLFSRSGVPYCAKSSHGTDPYGDYAPVVCTPDAFDALRIRSRRAGGIDFRAEVLPFVLDEMQARYHVHAAWLRGGSAARREVHARLTRANHEHRFEEVIRELATIDGAFDATAALFAGGDLPLGSAEAYEARVYRMVADDLTEALVEGGSPAKAAQEVTRILRDDLRSVIEFGGLTLDSYIDFQTNVRGRINRIEAGPPPLRSQQLLGLIDAGVVRVPFGPDPDLVPAADGRVTVRSTRLAEPIEITVDAVVRGHLDLPSLSRSASPLLRQLYDRGRLTQLSYGDIEVGSVAIDESFHPYDAAGEAQPTLSLLGVLTEGVRYFTHYLPSPRSRVRAVLDAEACVSSIIG